MRLERCEDARHHVSCAKASRLAYASGLDPEASKISQRASLNSRTCSTTVPAYDSIISGMRRCSFGPQRSMCVSSPHIISQSSSS